MTQDAGAQAVKRLMDVGSVVTEEYLDNSTRLCGFDRKSGTEHYAADGNIYTIGRLTGRLVCLEVRPDPYAEYRKLIC